MLVASKPVSAVSQAFYSVSVDVLVVVPGLPVGVPVVFRWCPCRCGRGLSRCLTAVPVVSRPDFRSCPAACLGSVQICPNLCFQLESVLSRQRQARFGCRCLRRVARRFDVLVGVLVLLQWSPSAPAHVTVRNGTGSATVTALDEIHSSS